MIKKITHNKIILAIIIPSSFNEPGINFFAPDDFSQQLAFMKHPQGKTIMAHVHNPVAREVHFTKEVLFIRKGKIRVDFFDNEKNYIESHILSSGGVILLSEGGYTGPRKLDNRYALLSIKNKGTYENKKNTSGQRIQV